MTFADTRPGDMELLEAVIGADHELPDGWEEAFEGMLQRLRRIPALRLTARQREWAEKALESGRYEKPPEYENLYSNATSPDVKKCTVKTIDLLKPENLPRRPPRRPAGD